MEPRLGRDRWDLLLLLNGIGVPRGTPPQHEFDGQAARRPRGGGLGGRIPKDFAPGLVGLGGLAVPAEHSGQGQFLPGSEVRTEKKRCARAESPGGLAPDQPASPSAVAKTEERIASRIHGKDGGGDEQIKSDRTHVEVAGVGAIHHAACGIAPSDRLGSPMGPIGADQEAKRVGFAH